MRQSGFTLIELIIAVAIVGILAAVGVPSFQNMVKIAAGILVFRHIFFGKIITLAAELI